MNPMQNEPAAPRDCVELLQSLRSALEGAVKLIEDLGGNAKLQIRQIDAIDDELTRLASRSQPAGTGVGVDVTQDGVTVAVRTGGTLIHCQTYPLPQPAAGDVALPECDMPVYDLHGTPVLAHSTDQLRAYGDARARAAAAASQSAVWFIDANGQRWQVSGPETDEFRAIVRELSAVARNGGEAETLADASCWQHRPGALCPWPESCKSNGCSAVERELFPDAQPEPVEDSALQTIIATLQADLKWNEECHRRDGEEVNDDMHVRPREFMTRRTLNAWIDVLKGVGKTAGGGGVDEPVADDFRSREHLFPFGLKLGAAAKFLTVHSPKGERPGWGWEAEYSQGKGYGYCSRAEAALAAVREAFRVYHNPIAELIDQVHDLEQEIKHRDAAPAGSGEAVAAAFWVQVSRQHEDDALIIWENGAQEVITRAAQFDADMHTIPEKVTTSPERVQIPAESTHVRCPRCSALMPLGLSCKGNPPDDPCPLRKA